MNDRKGNEAFGFSWTSARKGTDRGQEPDQYTSTTEYADLNF